MRLLGSPSVSLITCDIFIIIYKTNRVLYHLYIHFITHFVSLRGNCALCITDVLNIHTVELDLNDVQSPEPALPTIRFYKPPLPSPLPTNHQFTLKTKECCIRVVYRKVGEID